MRDYLSIHFSSTKIAWTGGGVKNCALFKNPGNTAQEDQNAIYCHFSTGAPRDVEDFSSSFFKKKKIKAIFDKRKVIKGLWANGV